MTEAEEQQTEETEVLTSIFEGDPDYKQIDKQTFQYTVTGTEKFRTLALRVYWPSQYPDVVPQIGLDLSHNNHIPPDLRTSIAAQIKEVAEMNVGMAMTFTLFDFVKENIGTLIPSSVGESQKKEKTEALTKRQKNKITNFNNADTRGKGWVDIIKHLSQTGGQETST